MSDLERFAPELKGRTAYEHLHRYALCRRLVEGKTVLDVACGEGYGAAILGTTAADVFGLDLDVDAVRRAAARYGGPGVQFREGSVERLPFADDSFDVVVSFETIEHVAASAQERFVAEIRRVLRPDGLLVISTPHREIYNRYKKPNAHHVEELDPESFTELLGRSFEHVALARQRMALVSLTAPGRGAAARNDTSYQGYLAKTQGGVFSVEDGVLPLRDGEYVLAFCSADPLPAAVAQPSLFAATDDDLWPQHERIMAWASGLHDEDEVLRRDLAETRARAEAGERRADEATTREAAAREALAELRALIGTGAPTAGAQARLDEALRLAQPLLRRLTGRTVEADLPSIVDAMTEAAVDAEVARRMADDLSARERAELAVAAERRIAEERAHAVSAAESERAQLATAEIRFEEERSRAAVLLDHEREERSRVVAALNQEREERARVAASLDQEREDRFQVAALLDQEREERSRIVAALDQEREEHSRVSALLDQERVRAAAAEALVEDERARVADVLAQSDAARAHVEETARRDRDAAAEQAAELESETARLRLALVQAADAAGRAVAAERDRAETADADAGRLRNELAALVEATDTQMALAHVSTDALAASLRDTVEQGRRTQAAFDAERTGLSSSLAAEGAARADAESREVRLLAATAGGSAASALAAMRQAIAEARLQASTAVRAAGGLRPCAPPYDDPVGEEDWDALAGSGLFDARWYAARLGGGIDEESAVAHFHVVGARLGFDPHPLFHSAFYAANAMSTKERLPPILHYLRRGDKAAAVTHPLFDPTYYRESHPDVDEDGRHPFQHYLAHGRGEDRRIHALVSQEWLDQTHPNLGRPYGVERIASDPALREASPHPLFDAAGYLVAYPDAAASPDHPLIHYLTIGWREGRKPSVWFDPDWYLFRNPEVLAARAEPLSHYVRHGWREGRDPNPAFSVRAYLAANPDVAASGLDPLSHYVLHGSRIDVRGAGPLSRTRFDRLPDAERKGDPLQTVLSFGPWRASAAAEAESAAWVASDAGGLAPSTPALQRHLHEEHDGRGEAAIGALMSVVERYAGRPATFDGSPEQLKLAEDAARLARRGPATPVASIIVPVHDKLLYTLTCCVAVLSDAGSTPFEIIVADDASNDATPDVIGAVGGVVRLVRSETNRGFLGNCNAAAQAARGDVIVFLNNDTLPLPGWLDALCATFDDPEVGLAGAKLLNGDGTLQEAGGILWRGGTGWNYGRGRSPAAPEFNYRKQVDYISGAAIAVRGETWRALGGFDPLFAPAYCEDSDFAMRVRQAGKTVVYQPRSEVVHHEGRSHGRDETSGIKAYQAINGRKLLDRWRSVWRRENFEEGEEVFLARDRSRDRPHVLIVDHYVPQHDQDAGSRTVQHYVRMFVDRGWHVTFWPENLNRDRVYVDPLQALGVEVIYGAAHLGGFEDWMRDNGRHLDVVLLNRPHVAVHFIDAIRPHSDARVLYYGHDLHYRRLERQREVTGEAALAGEIARFKAMELELCAKADVFLYPAQEEIDTVEVELGPQAVGRAIPMNVFRPEEIARPTARSIAARDPFALLFVGGFTHGPNVDGVRWFVGEVMPLLRQADPRWRLSVAGSNPPPTVQALAGDGVEILGRVSDEALHGLYAEVGMAVAPLRYGGGVKGKVIEALAKGCPIVTTSTGAQGLPGAEILLSVGDSPIDLAEAIVRTAARPEATLARIQAGVDFVRREYGAERAYERLAPLLAEPALTARAYPQRA